MSPRRARGALLFRALSLIVAGREAGACEKRRLAEAAVAVDENDGAFRALRDTALACAQTDENHPLTDDMIRALARAVTEAASLADLGNPQHARAWYRRGQYA